MWSKSHYKGCFRKPRKGLLRPCAKCKGNRCQHCATGKSFGGKCAWSWTHLWHCNGYALHLSVLEVARAAGLSANEADRGEASEVEDGKHGIDGMDRLFHVNPAAAFETYSFSDKENDRGLENETSESMAYSERVSTDQRTGDAPHRVTMDNGNEEFQTETVDEGEEDAEYFLSQPTEHEGDDNDSIGNEQNEMGRDTDDFFGVGTEADLRNVEHSDSHKEDDSDRDVVVHGVAFLDTERAATGDIERQTDSEDVEEEVDGFSHPIIS